MQRLLTRLALLAFVCLQPLVARADVYVVVHANNAQPTLSQKEAIDLFMGRTRSFANGDFVLLFDLPRDHPVRNAFYSGLVGMSPAQLNSYWSRLMFTGQNMPPQAVPDETAVANVVRRNPSAIGYVGHEPLDKGLRVIFVVRDVR